jgi:adenylate cyclase
MFGERIVEPGRVGLFLIKHYVMFKNILVDKARKANEALSKISISISTSIIGLVIISLCLFALVTIVFDYQYYKTSFAAASKKFLENTSHLTKVKIANYLKPFSNNLTFAVELSQSGILNPENHEQFSKYLLAMLKNNPSFVNVYEGDDKGNLYLMSRASKKGTYVMVTALRAADVMQVTEEVLDSNGKVLSISKKNVDLPDPRLRPWYTDAVQIKGQVWSDVYRFQSYSRYIFPILGISISSPIYAYDKSQVKGVFGIDMTLDDLASSMKDIDLIKGTTIFIARDKDDFKKIVYPQVEEKKVTFLLVSGAIKVNDVNLPNVEQSFEIFKKQHADSFFYEIDKSKYLAFYVSLKELFGPSWYAAIVIPTSSIDLYLQRDSKIVFLSLLSLFIAVIVISFILGKRLTLPIRKILDYAARIESLDFSQKLVIKSKVKEIKKVGQIVDLMASVLKSFSRYVPSYLVRDVIKSGDVAHIAGESKEISVLFVDICGFSGIAESMKPTDLMLYLSEYFDKLTKVIYSKGGTLDKYIGDAIMCFWGAPFDDKKHALHACQCAMMFYDALKEINKNWKLRGLPQLSIRSSVSSGTAVVGNVGSTDRLNYTALGDTINLASRLEGLNKVYGTEVLINENAYEAIKELFLCRLVDRVSVRGQTKGVYIYEIMRRDNEIVAPENLADYSRDFVSAFKFYEVGDWEKASAMFASILQIYPKDKLSSLYVDRCKFLLKEKSPENWDGIWKFS